MELKVQTPKGELVAIPTSDPDYPGFYIELDGQQVALIEYNLHDGIRTLAWNGKDEDFETATSFSKAIFCGSCEEYTTEAQLIDRACPQCGSGNWCWANEVE